MSGRPAAVDETRVRAIGAELLERARARRPASVALVEWALANEALKLRLFRLVDVLPALPDDRSVGDHLREYLSDGPAMTGAIRAALAVARAGWLGDKAVALFLRQAVRQLGRRLIAGATPADAARAAAAARQAGLGFTLDVLGEACLSEREAEAYQRAYLGLLAGLGPEAARWPEQPAIDRAPWGPLPRVNLSVKLSALYPHLDPVDPAGAADAVGARLRPVLRAAHAHAAHVQVDMEDRRLKDLTLAIFTALAEEDEWRASRALGVVLQAYLVEAEADAERLVAWARRRGTPVTVRLVKGAYWDHETALARLEGWPVPVYEDKSQTDACFERLTRFFLQHADVVDLAVGSHNVRSIAHAIAVREHMGLPAGQVEFQVLHGMAEPLARALAERGERVRVYMPFGELVPGMGYLVRRLLENTSNEAFLRRGLAGGEPADTLLADPAAVVRASAGTRPSAPPATADASSFGNEPHADFAEARVRESFVAALEAVRGQFDRLHPLRIGGRAVETPDTLVSRNPSRPSEVVGRTGSASAEAVDRAVAAAGAAFPAWRDLGAEGRGRVLGRAAALLRQRRWELAAWALLEAGKPWREADADVAEAIDFLEYYRGQARELLVPRRLGDRPGEVNHYLREPCGVAAVIAPWNFPLAILTGMTAAALATGNTVVMKPAEQTPVIAAHLVSILEEAGVPPGAVNYVPGAGEVAGAALVRHPGVRVIAFTGSREVGVAIHAEAARVPAGGRHLKRVVAEMGGKNAVIVDEDADLDEAVPAILGSAFGYAGQKCSACSRVIAVGAVHDRLLGRLVDAARTLPLGPADHPATVVGPVIEAAAVERIAGYVDLGKRTAEAALLRAVPPELAALGPLYVAPAIFAGVSPDSPLAREEIFGPVLSVLRARGFEEALALALDSDYALTGGLFSRSPRHLRAAREGFRVGNLYLNRAVTGARVGRQPFGGRRLSGAGWQAGGPDYLLQFVESRVVTELTLRRGFVSGELS